jgi:hypothetical protein
MCLDFVRWPKHRSTGIDLGIQVDTHSSIHIGLYVTKIKKSMAPIETNWRPFKKSPPEAIVRGTKEKKSVQ